MISAAARKRRIAASPGASVPELSSGPSSALGCCPLRSSVRSPPAARATPAMLAVFRKERRSTMRFNVQLTFSPVDGAAASDNSAAGTFFSAIGHLPILLELFRLEIQFVNSNYLP